MKDEIFKKPISKQFEFDEEVATVFDDMIGRSVPFYKENLALVRDLVIKNLQEDATIYDLGCSTGTLLIEIAKKSDKNLYLKGIDNSAAMLQRAKNKAKAFGVDIEFIYADILEYDFSLANCFIANYTLQFIRPLKREKFVKKIYEKLEDEGVFIFSEKIITEDKRLNKQLIDIYYDFKREQGYSDYEIAQKREALENVLIPYTLKENEEMLLQTGFRFVEPIFRWANFATFFARK
ncbi:carboxy-S-adenosyl-L-methionine synthase CmoA [Nitratiruptor tergarcus]|uniref:Carboxy-S-adenosyl-L-methionine synthase n=1 Tax=Nitratiruptor tergarcus DSM 16512 TaxID=1069081 RepID=A0A1W1WT84_9BACT|nr:carboxy-S-adenosyl-L-methionine synthase CmoA [Nitratiruptor tergarcus]SMC09412.1 tRNA (cmo5U34)-methyltransferase [Nitratiruptor tergarcus DSM 16512]